MTKPTERTDWATAGDGSGGANAIRTATDSSRWNLGWQTTPGNLPGEQGEKPNLNEQNYWQYAVHKWREYLETEKNTITTYQSLRNWTQITSPKTTGYTVSVCFWSNILENFLIFYTSKAENYRTVDGFNFPFSSNVDNNASWITAAENDSIIVVVGSGGAIQTSTDGVTWTTRTSPVGTTTHDWRAVTWGNGKFIAVASNSGTNNVIESSDGITWTIAATLPGTTTRGWSVIWSEINSVFVVGGWTTGATTDTIWTSPDGTTWTARDADGDNEIRFVSENTVTGRLVATCSFAGGPATSPVIYSDDGGVTWNAGTVDKRGDTTIQDYDVGLPSYWAEHDLFFTISSTNKIFISRDGIDWVYFREAPFSITGSNRNFSYSPLLRMWLVPQAVTGGTYWTSL